MSNNITNYVVTVDDEIHTLLSKAMKLRWQHERKVAKICEVCLKQFYVYERHRNRARFCSNRCRQYAYRSRMRYKARKTQMRENAKDVNA